MRHLACEIAGILLELFIFSISEQLELFSIELAAIFISRSLLDETAVSTGRPSIVGLPDILGNGSPVSRIPEGWSFNFGPNCSPDSHGMHIEVFYFNHRVSPDGSTLQLQLQFFGSFGSVQNFESSTFRL
jgi:hypothetical protein